MGRTASGDARVRVPVGWVTLYIIPSREGTAGEGGTLMQVPGVFFQQRQGNMFEGGRVGGGQ